MKLRLLLFVLAVAFLGISLGAQSSPNGSGSSQNSVETKPEIHGFDLSAMDRTADPCNDFYQYACGTWVKNTPIPPDQGRWGRFSQLAERNRLIARQILEQASTNDPKRDPVHQKIGDYYQACMDEKAVNDKGIKPLQTELDRINALNDRNALIDELAPLLQLGDDRT